jgi:hypothetical protein
MGKREGAFEFSPIFVAGGLVFPEFAVIMEKASLEDELVGGGHDLRRRVWSMSGSGEIDSVFDLTKEKFDGLVCVVVGFHLGVVGEKVRGPAIGVGSVEVVKEILCAAVLVAGVFGAKRAEEHGINGTPNLLFEGFVGGIVLPEKRGGLVVGAVKLLNC